MDTSWGKKYIYYNKLLNFLYFVFSEVLPTNYTPTSETGMSRTSTVEATTSQPITNPVYWDEKSTKFLISEMKVSTESDGKTTKKKLFVNISVKLEKAGYKFTWEQVQGKWKTLTSALKRTKDHNSRSGNDTKSCPFQTELEDIFEGNPTINPIATCSSSLLPQIKRKAEESTENSSEETDADEVSRAATCKKSRKSNSSEMVELMKDLINQQQIDRQKQSEEKTRIHNEKKEMHREKMNIFKDFLKEMKD